MKSAETLPEQQGQSKTAVPHVSGQHDEQPDGERVTESVYQGLMEAQSILPRIWQIFMLLLQSGECESRDPCSRWAVTTADRNADQSLT